MRSFSEIVWICLCVRSVVVSANNTGRSNRFGDVPEKSTTEKLYYGFQNLTKLTRDFKFRSFESSNAGPPKDNEYLTNIEKNDSYGLVSSGVLVEPLSRYRRHGSNDSDSIGQHNAEESVGGFSPQLQESIVHLHNLYRMNATPSAGNMNFMEWDDELARYGQMWAEGCAFKHGTPEGTEYSRGIYGQNLYFGYDSSGYNGLWMFYEEYQHYNVRTQYCKPNEQCGHYVQMAWGPSNRVGCGIKKCGQFFLIVCHYHPPALSATQMYTIGEPCSQCGEGEGARCLNNLCITPEQCERNNLSCDEAKCSLKCKNCGIKNKTSCSCKCADGWDSLDCSRPCKNEHERCGKNPGFPNKGTCPMNNYSVQKKLCRRMCESCYGFLKDKTANHHCCNGIVCEEGYILDNERKPCRCTKLCPGPLCDGRGSSIYSVTQVKLTTLVLWLILFLNKCFYF